MKKLLVVVSALLMSSVSFGQSEQFLVHETVVQEAQKKILSGKHEDRLAQAKNLLERKAELEKQLGKVNESLKNVIACDDKDQGWLGTSCKEDSVTLTSGVATWTSAKTLTTNAGVVLYSGGQ